MQARAAIGAPIRDEGAFLVELERRWIEPHMAIKSGTIDPTGDHANDGT